MARREKKRIVSYDRTPFRRRALGLPLLGLALLLYVELCNRGLSPARLFAFITGRPVIFLCNGMIILTTLVFSELFRRRRAVLGCVTLLWVVLGFVQFMVAKDRTTPFSSMDLLLLREAFSLITVYCTLPQIVLMFVGVFLVVALVVTLFARSKRRRRRSLPRALLAFVGCVLLCVMTAAVGIRAGMFPQRFDSLVENYRDYGFPVVFTYTFGQMGISKPETYTPETVDEIMTDIDGGAEAGEDAPEVFGEADNPAQPNILFVQLESFIDVGTIKGCELSRDPTPCFNKLCAENPSGLLVVPTVGGGTANTEFEVITGMDLEFFGLGETPYNTILQEYPCESMAFSLRELGYTATAMHNNGATFYHRNVVFPKLGFDCFVPVEYMQNVHYNSLGWARDEILTDEIMTVLNASASRDLVMCITVESHGKYQESYEYREGDIEVLSLPEEVPLAPLQNYVNVLPRTDAFLQDLIDTLSDFHEPTVVVAYGDHLPALELTDDMLTTGSIYASRYVIWNNYGHDFEARDLLAYRLNAFLLKQLGFSGGVLTKLHQSVEPDEAGEEYLSKLELLEYDMLYGDRQAFGGEFPYEATDMRLGSRDIAVSRVEQDYHRLLVSGQNFTEYSRIVVGEEVLDTLFVDPGHIIARLAQDDGPVGSESQTQVIDEVCVAQIDTDGLELSRVGPFPVARQ